MIKVDVKYDNFEKILSTVSHLSHREQKSILRKSANDVANRLVKYFGYTIGKYVDRPKAITINSLFARYAKGESLDSSIEFKVSTSKANYYRHWLASSVFGGPRRDKGLDGALRAYGYLPAGYQAVPTDSIRTDGYGNVRGAYIQQMISFLRIDRSQTQNRARGEMDKKQLRKYRRGKKWWVEVIGNRRGLMPGIYEFQEGGLGKRVKLVFMFKQTTYRKTFPFFDLAGDYSSKSLLNIVKDRIEKILKQ